jgi:hypothetical protein
MQGVVAARAHHDMGRVIRRASQLEPDRRGDRTVDRCESRSASLRQAHAELSHHVSSCGHISPVVEDGIAEQHDVLARAALVHG